MPSFKVDPASTNTFGAVTITDVNSFGFTRDGTETTFGSDGDPWLKGSYIGDMSYLVTVSSATINLAIKKGDVGSLSLRAKAQTNGSGTTGSTIVYTFANAVCLSNDITVNHMGNSEASLSFRAVSADGATDALAIS
jgi:hypothetical protein